MSSLPPLDQTRATMLVGSIPGSDTHAAVDLALSEMGPTLLCLPDGETGARSQWVASIIDALRDHPAIEMKRDGHWRDYNDRPRYRVRRGARLDPDQLQLGYAAAHRESRPILEELATRHGLTDLDFQVGVASGFDLALLSFGPIGALLHRHAFNQAADREIRSIRDTCGDHVVFQIELPAELVAASRTPRLARGPVTRWMAGVSVEPAALAAPGTRFGIHLCFGDLHHRALMRMGADCASTVRLANAIAARWPAHVELDYMHIPLAAGDQAPSLDSSYYAALRDLSLPEHTRLVAGFVHDALSHDELVRVLQMVEAAAGRRVDVAAPCGLGRRDVGAAQELMRASRQLTAT
jgi:hypothetical protein